MSSAAEWLANLATQDEVVRTYLDCYAHEYRVPRSTYVLLYDVVNSPAAMVGLVEALILAKERTTKAFLEHTMRHIDPPILVIDKLPDDVVLDMKPGSIITAGEWPKTERTVIEVSEVVYFRDFLRSLWRRLRRHRKV